MVKKARKCITSLSDDGLVRLKTNQFPAGKEFNFMFQEGWNALADLRLSPTETAVFFKLMARMGFANWVPVSQETLGEELGIKTPNVSAALKRLTQLNVVERERDPIDKRRWQYRINTSLGWKGSPDSWTDENESDKVVPLFTGRR